MITIVTTEGEIQTADVFTALMLIQTAKKYNMFIQYLCDYQEDNEWLTLHRA